MNCPTTIKGYVSMLKKVAFISAYTLKDFEKLEPEQQKIINIISAEIYNLLGEYEQIVSKLKGE